MFRKVKRLTQQKCYKFVFSPSLSFRYCAKKECKNTYFQLISNKKIEIFSLIKPLKHKIFGDTAVFN
mgnify:CR=1 FL=1